MGMASAYRRRGASLRRMTRSLGLLATLVVESPGHRSEKGGWDTYKHDAGSLGADRCRECSIDEMCAQRSGVQKLLNSTQQVASLVEAGPQSARRGRAMYCAGAGRCCRYDAKSRRARLTED